MYFVAPLYLAIRSVCFKPQLVAEVHIAIHPALSTLHTFACCTPLHSIIHCLPSIEAATLPIFNYFNHSTYNTAISDETVHDSDLIVKLLCGRNDI